MALGGLVCVVFRTTSAFSRAAMAGLRPGRVASLVRPSSPKRKNRFRHRAAFWLLIPRAAAISRSVRPAAANSTTLARSTWRAGSERDPAKASNENRRNLRGPPSLRTMDAWQHNHSFASKVSTASVRRPSPGALQRGLADCTTKRHPRLTTPSGRLSTFMRTCQLDSISI